MPKQESGDVAESWIVGISKPNREAWGAENIQRQGYEAYFPRFQETIVNKDRQVVERIRCLFPRYVFVKTDGHWHFLLSTFGMVGVVLKGEVPATMPGKEIKKLRKRENKSGLIVLPPKPLPTRFTKGQRLRVTHGPFSGLSAICQVDNASERVRVLLQFLGASRGMFLPRDAVVAA
jgi:transcriptional antiterminator RfaH